MTVQTAEILHYQGRTVEMCTEPLLDYFALEGGDPGFEVRSPQLQRGYHGRWEISDGCLYLTGLQANLMDGTEADLATLFPEAAGRVFAVWYSGALHLREGSKEFFLEIACGTVTRRRPARSTTPETGAVPGDYTLPAATGLL